MEVDWTFVPCGSQPTTAPGNIAAFATAFNLGWQSCLGGTLCCPAPLDPYFSYDTGADSDDVMINCITTSATAPGLYMLYAFGQASGGICGLSGWANTVNQVTYFEEFGYRQLDEFLQLIEPCEYHGTALDLGLSAASVKWSVDYDVPGYLLISVDWNKEGLSGSTTEACVCQIARGGMTIDVGYPVRQIDHLVIKIVAMYDDDSTATEIIRGIHATEADLTETRLGFFTDTDFDDGNANPDKLSGSVIGFTIPITIDLATAVSFSMTGETESFSAQNGDLTPSSTTGDVVCWTDRVLFVQAYGSTFTDEAYNPRVDFDLDGDVDDDDYATYLTIFNATACTADYDCNGLVEVPDIFAFQSAWYGGTLAGDFDGNGIVEVPDIFAHLSAWFAGCP